MKIAWLTPVLLVMAGIASAGLSDNEFMHDAAQGNALEVELGKLAQQRATEPAVKQLADRMIKDHMEANDKLKAIAGTKGVTSPGTSSATHQDPEASLGRLSGRSFDDSYIEALIAGHKDDIHMYQDESSNGKDADVKAFASMMLPTLKAHLAMIQAIAAKRAKAG